MNINQLEYLAETVRIGSYSGVAKRLFVTPQAISKALAELERELHVELVVKSGRGIKPTKLAFLLADQAEDVLQILADMRSCAEGGDGRPLHAGSITLAIATARYQVELFPIAFFDPYREKYPRIKLSFVRFTTDSCLSALRLGLADAAIVFSQDDDPAISYRKLFSFSLCVAVSATHQLAGQAYASLKDLAKNMIALPQDLAIYAMLKARIESGVSSLCFEKVAPGLHAHHAFLESGGGVLVAKNVDLPSEFADITILPLLPEERLSLPVYYAHLKNSDQSQISTLENYLSCHSRSLAKQL